MNCSWRTEVTWLADASPPSSSVTRSFSLTICADRFSTVTCCSQITTLEASWFPLYGVFVNLTVSFVVTETLASSVCYKVVVLSALDFPFFL